MSPQPPSIPFIGANGSDLIVGAPAIIGVPYDKTASFRKGTRLGPDAIRKVSDAGIETYSPASDRDLEQFDFADLGNLEIDPEAAPGFVAAELHRAVTGILNEGAVPFVLGGEHSISPGAIQAAFEVHPDLLVVQFDAHADLRESYEGSRHSHACAMRRVLDFLPSQQLLQVGIRSGTADEFREMRTHQRLIPASAVEIRSALAHHEAGRRPVWVTFDVDVFDPSEVPGTGTPEAGGLTWREFEQIRPLFAPLKLVGIDLVELAPMIDPTNNSSVLVAKLLREWLLTC